MIKPTRPKKVISLAVALYRFEGRLLKDVLLETAKNALLDKDCNDNWVIEYDHVLTEEEYMVALEKYEKKLEEYRDWYEKNRQYILNANRRRDEAERDRLLKKLEEVNQRLNSEATK